MCFAGKSVGLFQLVIMLPVLPTEQKISNFSTIFTQRFKDGEGALKAVQNGQKFYNSRPDKL